MQGNFIRVLAGLVMVFGLSAMTGCGWLVGEEGWIKDRKNEYRKAEVLPRMEVPDELDRTAISDLYMVPVIDPAADTEGDFEVPRPESFVGNTQKEVRAFKSENRYWISLNGSPAQVWSRVRRFWEINGIQLAKEVPYEGVMETIWLFREVDGNRTNDKFRVRVEHGMRENSSEVHIMHLGVSADVDRSELSASPDWTQVKAGDEVAVAIMQEVANFLIDTEYEGAPASLLAQSFSGSPKSSLATDDSGNTVLLLKLDYNRAWEAVGKAINDGALELEDLDRSSGVYYVSYYPDAKSGGGGGWFSFLKFGKGKGKGTAHKFKVELKNEPQRIVVAVIGEASETGEMSEVVLAQIRENLI